MGKSQLSKYERGKELPKLESLERVLTVLGVGYFEFSRVLRAIDRNEVPTPQTREDVDELFNSLTQGIFVLHREVVKLLPEPVPRGTSRKPNDDKTKEE